MGQGLPGGKNASWLNQQLAQQLAQQLDQQLDQQLAQQLAQPTSQILVYLRLGFGGLPEFSIHQILVYLRLVSCSPEEFFADSS